MSAPETSSRPGPAAVVALAPTVGTGARWTRRQRAAADAVTADAPCTPVFVRAAIVGSARMPRAALEVSAPDGTVIGNVALPNTSADFDPQQRFWLVGVPEHGQVVALVSEGATQVLLPGSRLRAGAVDEPDWSALACRMLGWQAGHGPPAEVPGAAGAVFATQDASVRNPRFTGAVRRFRTAAVTVPALFFVVCFAYLFAIRPLLDAGADPLVLLALPVVGGGLMAAWAAKCRRQVGEEADRIEAGAARWGKEIAFTQSYWTGMRKPSPPWDGPVPDAVR